MRRKTQKQPQIFKVGEEEFRTTMLGFLESGEILLKHRETIFSIMRNVREIMPSEEDSESEDFTLDESAISKVLKDIKEKEVTEASMKILASTEVRDIDDNGNVLSTYSPVNPQDFSSTTEFFKVIFEVFKRNFPNFFQEGNGIDQLLETPEPVKMEEKVTLPLPEKDKTILL
jgi:hypothetical protein